MVVPIEVQCLHPQRSSNKNLLNHLDPRPNRTRMFDATVSKMATASFPLHACTRAPPTPRVVGTRQNMINPVWVGEFQGKKFATL